MEKSADHLALPGSQQQEPQSIARSANGLYSKVQSKISGPGGALHVTSSLVNKDSPVSLRNNISPMERVSSIRNQPSQFVSFGAKAD